jgi:hypothetical protein
MRVNDLLGVESLQLCLKKDLRAGPNESAGLVRLILYKMIENGIIGSDHNQLSPSTAKFFKNQINLPAEFVHSLYISNSYDPALISMANVYAEKRNIYLEVLPAIQQHSHFNLDLASYMTLSPTIRLVINIIYSLYGDDPFNKEKYDEPKLSFLVNNADIEPYIAAALILNKLQLISPKNIRFISRLHHSGNNIVEYNANRLLNGDSGRDILNFVTSVSHIINDVYEGKAPENYMWMNTHYSYFLSIKKLFESIEYFIKENFLDKELMMVFAENIFRVIHVYQYKREENINNICASNYITTFDAINLIAIKMLAVTSFILDGELYDNIIKLMPGLLLSPESCYNSINDFICPNKRLIDNRQLEAMH